jgi:hypothetical protein
MQQTTSQQPRQSQPGTGTQIRLQPSIHLCRGDTVGGFVEPMFGLSDAPRFGPASAHLEANDLSTRLRDQIQQVATYCRATQTDLRPLILPVPASLLETPSLIDACLNALSHTELCPQEIAFEFTDADMIRNTGYDFGLFRSLRMRGLRVAMDARQSWRCQLQPMSWLMVDTLRVRADRVGLDEDLDNMIAAAVDAGVSIVADKPRWRDGDLLARAGIEFGLSPHADA